MNRDFYEAHITVDCNDEERFRARCKELRLKPLSIELSHGLHKVQFMTSSFLKGAFGDVMRNAHESAALLDKDFPVQRVKLEAMMNNSIVPDHCRPGQYFEFHVKIHDAVLFDELEAECARHGAKLSWNRRKPGEYLTASRAYGAKEDALRHYDGLLAGLSGYRLSNRLREYVCHDSAPGFDAGWIDGK
jgi:hypothetical protein